MLLAVVEWPIISIICCGLSPEYFLGWLMIRPGVIVSLLSDVFSSFRSFVCSRSELDEELRRLGIAAETGPMQPPPRSPPSEDVDAETPALATADRVPADAMSGISRIN